MKRCVFYLAALGLTLMLAGCETKATKAPGGPSDAPRQQTPSQQPAVTPGPDAKQQGQAEPAADPFASAPGSQPSLGIPEIKPPEIAPPKIERKAAKPEAKK